MHQSSEFIHSPKSQTDVNAWACFSAPFVSRRKCVYFWGKQRLWGKILAESSQAWTVWGSFQGVCLQQRAFPLPAEKDSFAGWNTEKVSLIQICKPHPGIMDAVLSCLLYLSCCPEMLGRQMGESAVFLSLSFMWFYLANGKCCTVFLRFAFDTCSVSTKQWCYFSNIKGHYHSADCIWWCYISHSLSLYVISEILHIFSPN